MNSSVSEGTIFPPIEEAVGPRYQEESTSDNLGGNQGKNRRSRPPGMALQAAACILSFLQDSEALLTAIGLLQKQQR